MRRRRALLAGVGLAMIGGPASWLMASAQASGSLSGQSPDSAVTSSVDQGQDQTLQLSHKGDDQTGPNGKPPMPVPAPLPTGLHDGIVTTVFWVGETADANNANISNTSSAWDDNWQASYGGVDDPTSRNGYLPALFAPHENPFYVALPYNDFDGAGNRKGTAGSCANAAALAGNTSVSWCKNTWLKISHAGKTAYAQWEDVGPLLEDDAAYVFGSAGPANTWGAKAGLDVSPAIRDYLGLQNVDTTSWSFVGAGGVPAGSWQQVVTSSLGT